MNRVRAAIIDKFYNIKSTEGYIEIRESMRLAFAILSELPYGTDKKIHSRSRLEKHRA